jgi:NADH-quinone oxidoreductase subunit K
MIPVDYYIILSAILFTIGVAGVLIRRNALIIFMSIELMLNASNLAIVAFSSAIQSFSGQIFVFFVIAVAAAEVAVGLALIVEIFKSKHSIDVDQMSSLKGSLWKIHLV